MTRESIIENVQEDFTGYEYDESVNESVDGLCYGTSCSDECDCVRTFESCVRRSFEAQEAEYLKELNSQKALYQAEVSRGIHIPEGTKPELMPDLDGFF